jgi:hypothetical protein
MFGVKGNWEQRGRGEGSLYNNCDIFFSQGEQHGFRKSENIIATLEGEFCFFAKVFGYKCPDFNCTVCGILEHYFGFCLSQCISF